MNEISQLWIDKYRPHTLDNYVLNSDLKDYFKNMIKTRQIQNFSMIAGAGSGKTTLAKIIANETNAEVLFVKCATEGTIEILRTKVQEFCNALSFDNRIKIVILDELDSASSGGDNSFQKGLRTLIESAQSDTRFIVTANYQKIIPAVLSRCPVIPLKFDKKDLLLYVKKILDSENIEYNKESLKAFIEEAFQFHPDIRRIINYLQFCCNSGSLIVKLNEVVNSEKDAFIKTVVENTLSSKNILEVRKFYIQNKEKLGDYIEAGSLFFNYVSDNNLITEDGILKLVDQLYYLNTCVDKEPIFFGMLMTLKKFLNIEYK